MSGAPPATGGVAPLMGFANAQTFTAAGTTSWTIPAGVTACFVEMWGGGAGGGGGGGTGEPGYGGGYAARHVTGLVPGSSISVTVGSGGAGDGGNGGTGGTSSFGAYLSATGGGGSTTPGNGIGGEINIPSRKITYVNGTSTRNGGEGAPGGLFWKGGMGGNGTTTGTGGPGSQPGGAGGVGYVGGGGNGAAGMVIIYW
jgi:hypothetical protein